MMYNRALQCSLALAAMICLSSRGDQPTLPSGQLANMATHIVSGGVKRVYACEQGKEKGVTYYVIEMEVARVEKGIGPNKLEVLYVRCWQRKEKSKDPGVSNGQVEVPAVNQWVQVYLKRAPDGGYDVLEPNGFSKPATGH